MKTFKGEQAMITLATEVSKHKYNAMCEEHLQMLITTTIGSFNLKEQCN